LLRKPDQRARLAIVLLAVVALTNVRMVRAVWTEVNPAWNAQEALARFEPVVRGLPPGTEINFLTTTPSPASEDLILARFSLAPLRLVHGSLRPLVVMDSRSSIPSFDVKPAGLRQVADYGNGIRLFEREATP
jgi:hypothetical protein